MPPCWLTYGNGRLVVEMPNPGHKGVPIVWNIQAVTLAIGIIGVLLMGCGMSVEQQEAKVEEERKGFHCLSAWDGNHGGMEDLVRPLLNMG